jgi:AraC-like DNA-binding protein
MPNRFVRCRIGGFQRASGVINGVGYIYDKRSPFEVVQPRTIQAYVVVYLLEGGGVYSDPLNGERDVQAGDVVVLFPGLAHRYHRKRPEDVWSECFIEFEGTVFEALEADGYIDRKTPVLSPGLDAGLMRNCDDLLRDYTVARPGEEAMFCARMHLLLVQMVEADRALGARRVRGKFAAMACALLQASLETNPDWASVASRFGMSERTFRRRFTEEVGVAPSHYRVQQRIDAAKRLLHETALGVDEVAERLGYCDTKFLHRQFKQITGMTPAEFRRTRDALVSSGA